MTLLSTTTLSGLSTTLSSIPQTFNFLYLVITGMTGNTNNNAFAVSPNNVTNLTNTSVMAAATNTSRTDSKIDLTNAQGTLRTDANNVWVLKIDNYTSSTSFKPLQYNGIFIRTSTVPEQQFGQGVFRSNTAITSLVFDYDGNTFAGGTVLLYGVK